MNNMVTFSITMLVLMYFGYNVLGWCRDPLSLKLQDKLDMMNEDLDASQAECDVLRERLNSAGHHIRALKRLLNADTDSDTESVCRKRPRVNT